MFDSGGFCARIRAFAHPRTYADDDRPVPPSHHVWFPAIEGLFDVMRAALERDFDAVTARFDFRIGAPVSIAIDDRFGVADDELQLTVSRLRPR